MRLGYLHIQMHLHLYMRVRAEIRGWFAGSRASKPTDNVGTYDLLITTYICMYVCIRIRADQMFADDDG